MQGGWGSTPWACADGGHQPRSLARVLAGAQLQLVTESPMSLLATAVLPERPRSQRAYTHSIHSADTY